MDQQKVFATAWKGFEKKAVLDYIYEQDMLFKRKESEWEARLAQYEEKLESTEVTVAVDQYEERLEVLIHSYNEEKENSNNLTARYEALAREVEQLAQIAKDKEQQLAEQMERNGQLTHQCEMLEGKLKVLADHLIAAREAMATYPLPQPEPQPEADTADTTEVICEFADTQPEDEEIAPEYENIKEELEDFRQSVSKTLLNFEAALARLESCKGDGEPQLEDRAFFR